MFCVGIFYGLFGCFFRFLLPGHLSIHSLFISTFFDFHIFLLFRSHTFTFFFRNKNQDADSSLALGLKEPSFKISVCPSLPPFLPSSLPLALSPPLPASFCPLSPLSLPSFSFCSPILQNSSNLLVFFFQFASPTSRFDFVQLEFPQRYTVDHVKVGIFYPLPFRLPRLLPVPFSSLLSSRLLSLCPSLLFLQSLLWSCLLLPPLSFFSRFLCFCLFSLLLFLDYPLALCSQPAASREQRLCARIKRGMRVCARIRAMCVHTCVPDIFEIFRRSKKSQRCLTPFLFLCLVDYWYFVSHLFFLIFFC